MSTQSLLNSKLSVQFSILIGKYLPKRTGHWFSRKLSGLIGSIKNLEINRNIRANQYVANGEISTRQELIRLNKDVLHHAGQCYYDLYHYIDKAKKLEELVPLSPPMKEFIRLSHLKQGFLVIAPHLSNFDLVVSRLVSEGFKGKVISYPNPGSGYQLQNDIRASYGLELTPASDPDIGTSMTSYLKEGGMVATAVDRPLPDRKKRHYVRFFGRPSPVPVGYITTALAADVPIITVTAIMEKNGNYGFRISEPIELEKYRDKMDNLFLNAERVLKQVEEFIKLAPTQWLMYYPVWPDLMSEGL